jgi:hypothetical protein
MEELKKQVRKIVLNHLDKYRDELGISYYCDQNSPDLWIECEEEGYVYWSKQEWEPLSPIVRVSEFHGKFWVTVSTENVFLECFGIQINGNIVTIDNNRTEPDHEFWQGYRPTMLAFLIQEEEFREFERKMDRKAKLENLKIKMKSKYC